MKANWNQRYSRMGKSYGTEPNVFLKESYKALPMGRILCLAEGEGRNAVFLAQKGYQVTMVDYSEVGVENAKKLASQVKREKSGKNKDGGVPLNAIVDDLQTFELGENKWEGVISIFGHTPPTIRKRIHSSLNDALAPGGVYLAIGYSHKQLDYKTGGPPSLDLLYNPEEIAEELSGLKMEHLKLREREIIEGDLHTGLASVVEIVAKKTV